MDLHSLEHHVVNEILKTCIAGRKTHKLFRYMKNQYFVKLTNSMQGLNTVSKDEYDTPINKHCVNEVSLTGQNLTKKCCYPLEILT